MSKIEERHDNELVEAVKFGNLVLLEQKFNNLIEIATLDNTEELEQLCLEIIESSKQNLLLSESLNTKTEKNIERQKRKYHDGSFNLKIDVSKTYELGETISNPFDTPEEELLKKEKQIKIDRAINSLTPKTRIIFKSYLDSMERYTNENFSKFSKEFSATRFKISDKTFKNNVRKVQEFLRTVKESDF